MILDVEVGVHNRYTVHNRAHKTDFVLHLEIALLMTKVLLLQTLLAHDMTTIEELVDLIAPLIDLQIDLPIHMTLVITIDLVFVLEILTFPDILLHSDHLRNQETLDTPGLGHTPIHETNLILFNHKLPMILSTLKYPRTILLKWQLL